MAKILLCTSEVPSLFGTRGPVLSLRRAFSQVHRVVVVLGFSVSCQKIHVCAKLHLLALVLLQPKQKLSQLVSRGESPEQRDGESVCAHSTVCLTGNLAAYMAWFLKGHGPLVVHGLGAGWGLLV